MKIVAIASLLLLGCSSVGPTNESHDAGSEEASSRPHPSISDDDVDHGDTTCHRSEHIVFTWDGGSKTYDIPLPCDPFWKMKDRGDPAP